MNFLTTYETPLRSYIQARITLLENALEEEVRNRDNVDIALLEQQFDRESDNFIVGLTRRINQIRDEIKAHRPTNTQAPDYESRMIQYRQFIHSSSISMNRMTDIINSVFDQDTLIQVIQNKYKKFKTLVLKLKSNDHHSDLSSFNTDQLDEFVAEIITDLQNTLVFNTNDLCQRIKQARPVPDDPLYANKMIIYKELLEQMISVMQKLQSVIGRTLDELHILVEQLWNDITQNNGENVDRLLEEHANQTDAYMNKKWMKHINILEAKLSTLNQMN